MTPNIYNHIYTAPEIMRQETMFAPPIPHDLPSTTGPMLDTIGFLVIFISYTSDLVTVLIGHKDHLHVLIQILTLTGILYRGSVWAVRAYRRHRQENPKPPTPVEPPHAGDPKCLPGDKEIL